MRSVRVGFTVDQFAAVDRRTAQIVLYIFADQARAAILIDNRMICLVRSNDSRITFEPVGAMPIDVERRRGVGRQAQPLSQRGHCHRHSHGRVPRVSVAEMSMLLRCKGIPEREPLCPGRDRCALRHLQQWTGSSAALLTRVGGGLRSVTLALLHGDCGMWMTVRAPVGAPITVVVVSEAGALVAGPTPGRAL